MSVTDQAGNRTVLSPGLVAATGPLPADFPTISVYYSDPSRMEPGFTLMDKTRRFGAPGGTYSIIVDNNGDVRWYSTVGGEDGMRQLPNGRLLLLNSAEMDLLGNVFTPRVLDVPGLFLHHDLYPTSYGNFLSLTLEKIVMTDYPTSEIDPTAPTQTVEITSDAVVEFLPDGSLYTRWEHDGGQLSQAVARALAESPRRRAFLAQLPTNPDQTWHWITDNPEPDTKQHETDKRNP